MSKGMIISLRKQLKEARARIEELERENVEAALDKVRSDPVPRASAVYTVVKRHLANLGEPLGEHDTVGKKLTNIVTEKNGYKQLYFDLRRKGQVLNLLIESLGIIDKLRKNTVDSYTASQEFLEHPIIKALLAQPLKG